MTAYDLRSLDLPKLYGKTLSLFAGLIGSPATRPLLIGSLLENGGIPGLRKLRLSEPPTYYPLAIPPEHAAGPLDLPQDPPTTPRTPRDKLPFTLVRDYALAYRDGSLTPLQAAEAVIQAIAASETTTPPLRAFSASLPDDIRRQAAESTERLARGRPRSLLEGVPVAIKEELDLLPYPTTVGTRFLGAAAPRRDARVVECLRAAGAILTGKTNMHEIGIAPNGANPHTGRVANPYNLQHDPGGSSGGSAAAVAAGIVPVAIGADGGGSIRIPASLCGVVGLKPTFGRVSEAGAAPLDWSVAHLGPLGASVEDVALVYAVIAGPDPAEPLTLQQPPVSLAGWDTPDLDGVRLGIYPEWFRHASRAVVEINEQMVAEFEKAGATVVEVTIPGLDAMRVAHAVTILSEMAAAMKNHPEHWGEFAASTRLSLTLGGVMTSADYLQAQRVRTRALQTFAGVFQEVDVILTPATALAAPRVPAQAVGDDWSDLGTDVELMRYAFPANLTGLPAISFPVGYTPEGLPVGMQAMGRHWEEALLLRVAYNAELRLVRRQPPVYFPGGPT